MGILFILHPSDLETGRRVLLLVSLSFAVPTGPLFSTYFL